MGGTCEQKTCANLEGIEIYFMPHCERFLYEEVFSSQKNAALVIGNSIQ